MKKYNISKYNPELKDNSGRYLKEDWTAISDIGKSFDGKVLSSEDYLEMEDKYIKAVYEILDFCNLKSLNVQDVRKSFKYDRFIELINERKIVYNEDLLKLYNSLESIKILPYQEIGLFCRLLLREDIGAKVSYPRKLKIFICYDYLLGIHSNRSIEKVIPRIKDLGLFVEELSE
jgi:hypothetical protein